MQKTFLLFYRDFSSFFQLFWKNKSFFPVFGINRLFFSSQKLQDFENNLSKYTENHGAENDNCSTNLVRRGYFVLHKFNQFKNLTDFCIDVFCRRNPFSSVLISSFSKFCSSSSRVRNNFQRFSKTLNTLRIPEYPECVATLN